MAAIRLARGLDKEDRPATADEQRVLAGWSSWGALPQVFDENNPSWATERDELRGLLDESAWRAARRTTLNAHYTSPEISTAMWGALERLGFTGGSVLEPGCGSGTFIGTAPALAQMVGVELDPTTAQIAGGLYPAATVRVESFADSRFSEGQFDAVIGNVPFGDVRLYDPQHNAGNHSIHNHFIIKSLALTRPGGMVAVLTSRYTMDSTNPAARREMQSMADLVGAVRLPSGAHRRSAGTEAVTDVLIFRRRGGGEPAAAFDWDTTVAGAVPGSEERINRYFGEHPDRVLGSLSTEHGMYGANSLVVTSPDLTQTPAQLDAALNEIVEEARGRGLTMTAPQATTRVEPARVELTELWDGTIVDAGVDGFQVAQGGRLVELKVPKTQHQELRALLELRDGARALLTNESVSRDDTDGLADQRAALKARYEAYVARYGPLNRYELRRTGRAVEVLDDMTGQPLLNPDTGQPEMTEGVARLDAKVMYTFRQDPHAPLTRALERFDEETQAAEPASLLVRRVVTPRPELQGADTPQEAVAMSLDRTGRVELPLVASLLGVEEDVARAQLGTMVFDDPDTGELVYEPEYLSGDVRIKLERAVAAAAEDPRFEANVDALRQVQPEPIGIEQIEARMGSVWISPEIHRQFLQELLRDRSVQVDNPMPGAWEVRGFRRSVLATSEWGTDRRSAIDIAKALMEQRRIEVKDEVEDGDRTRLVINPVETTAAQEKGELMQQRFSEWVWEEPSRAATLAAEYNRRFNSIVLRDYSSAGDHLTLPGLSSTYVLKPHQRAAVARMLAEPTCGLFHQVGAGKTLEMVVGATELKRTGLINKPLIVVPNHMLEQFSREWLHAYPNARVLAASTKDLESDKRRQFVARAATNNWDAIIMTQGAFKKIGVSAEVERKFVEAQCDELRESLTSARQERSISVKRIESALTRLENELKKKLDKPVDPGVNFEDMGVDYVIVDEAHMYKNLMTVSNIQGAAIAGSQQALDLYMKYEWLRSKYGLRVGTIATATPLANSITEAYVMQRYMRPDLLKDAGLTSFDGWAATFGQVVTDMEMSPTGKFRMKDRFAKFQNVPEMLRMWSVFADVKTAEDLDLPVPAIAPRASDGKREVETIVLDPTPELVDYIEELGERADRVASGGIDPSEDNMLLISGDGRKAALDMRLVDEDHVPAGPVKLDAVARQITKVWRQTRDNQYLDELTGNTSPVRGALQLVFCDLGTPRDNGWSAYAELKQQLVAEGMEPSAVRFIHEAKNDAEKARLFAAARSGHIAVLIGSTAKMGVGTNVQNRLAALHHIDCPWRPADIEQRDGRGVRQGNQNKEISLFRYVVEKSFDAYSWQTVARKAQFIAQVMRGRLDSREIDDVGDTTLSATEAKALASGNPLLLEKASADNELAKLRRQEVAYSRAQSTLVYTQSAAMDLRASTGEKLEVLRDALERVVDIAGDKFTMTIGGQRYGSRADAAEALGKWAATHHHEWWNWRETPVVVGTIGGHTFTAHCVNEVGADYQRQHKVVLQLDGVPMSAGRIDVSEFQVPSVGTIRVIENKTTAIAKNIATLEGRLDEAQRTIDEVAPRIGKPFPHAEALTSAAARVESINERLKARAQRQTQPEAGQAPSEPSKGAAPIDEIRRRAADLLRDPSRQHPRHHPQPKRDAVGREY